MTVAAKPEASPEVFQQLGLLTRQLHDTLTQLGVMPGLQHAAVGLPDAKSRLHYIARKTGEAADRVLNSVDQAKLEQTRLREDAQAFARALTADPVRAVASGAALNFTAGLETTMDRVDRHLTDIMLAQDFHDLTGQVIGKVVGLAGELEEALVKLLVQTAPAEALKVEAAALAGPVVDAKGKSNVVTNQGEVDDLLASLGF